MDKLNQVGKQLKKIFDDSEHNKRRVSENFPMVERKTDTIIFDRPYKMEFTTSDHPHSVKLNLYISPPASCFRCNILYQSPDTLQATAVLPTYGPADGNPYPLVFSSFSSHVTPDPDLQFELNSEGVIVPMDGLYTAQFASTAGGVTISNLAAIVATVRHNGVIKGQQSFSVTNGKLPGAPSFFGAAINVYGLCIEMRAGDSVEAWAVATGIAFYNLSGTYMTVKLVGYL